MKKVVILQRVAPHYRINLFELMAAKLKKEGVELKVVYGQQALGGVPKSVKVDSEWAVCIENTYTQFLGLNFVWQPALNQVKDADLVIVEQANRLVINYVFLLKRLFTKFNLAFWGHGKNLQSRNESGFLEAWKRKMSVNVDWWFTYTARSAETVKALGFSASKITNLENSIDTSALKLAKDAVPESEISELKARLGISSSRVGIYCGGIYKEKNIEFLIASCKRIKKETPDFQMIFIGDGPDSKLVKDFSSEFDWVHYLGEITGNERVPYFMVSSVFLMPGLVGLAVLDSFALNVPMITTDIPFHSPEVDYLKTGINGLITKPDLESFSSEVIALLNDDVRRLQIVENCKRSCEKYSLDNMASNFSEGILKSISDI